MALPKAKVTTVAAEAKIHTIGRNPGLDDPLEKDECIKIVHVVFVYNHVN